MNISIFQKYMHKKSIHTLLISVLFILFSSSSKGVGFSLLDIPNKGHTNISVGVWYPSDAKSLNTLTAPINQRLVKDAHISVLNAPLVIISHGYGGWMGSHANTALKLAEAGFIVAALSHTGNTFKDMSSSIDQWIIERPKQVSVVIDYLSDQWEHRSVLDNQKIGVFGFSAGGQTALSLVGAVPNFSVAKAKCELNPSEFVCKQGMINEILASKMDSLPNTSWGADSRISAAVIAAPGLGIAYDKEALKDVQVPIQLWSGLLDDRVPHQSNTKPIADALGRLSDNNWVEKAGHFSFILHSCTKKLKEYEPKTWAFLCVDKQGFDRKEFHQKMNGKIARFFKTHL